MNRFRTILVFPIELRPSDPAVATAADMAAHTGAELTIVSIEPQPGRGNDRDPPNRAWHRRRQLDGELLVERLHSRRISVRSVVLSGGDPAELILERVQVLDVDLIIKTAREDDVPTGRFYSTVATRLLQRSPCPVWIVRESAKRRAPRILAAVGPFGTIYEQQQSDAEILDVAGQLAAARRGELHVVSAWYPIMMPRHVSAEEYRKYLRECEEDARSSLRRVVADDEHGISWRNVHLRGGRADEVIAKVADEIDADVVVVGSAGRTGLRRLLLGNTVEDVLRRLPRATLGVRTVAA